MTECGVVATLKMLLTTLPELLQEVLESGHLRSVRIVHPALEEAPERVPDIAVGGEIVGHRLQEIVGVEVVDPLRAVPARVADAH